MITVNSISGGKTSCYMALVHPADLNIFSCVCIDDFSCKPKDHALYKYCLDKLHGHFIASAEHDKTLKIMMDMEQLLGKEIIWVRGKSFDQIIDEAGVLPTWVRRFCTVYLKIIPCFEYTYFRYGKVKMNIGFRADEIDRIINYKGGTVYHPVSCRVPYSRLELKEQFASWDAKPKSKTRTKNMLKIGKHLLDYPIYKERAKRMNWQSIEWLQPEFPLKRTFHYDIRKFWREIHPQILFPEDSNCRGCHHKPKELLQKNYMETPEYLQWFANQEKKGKFNTWHDDGVPYEEIFQMRFTEEINFSDFTMCNSGACTD